MIDKLMYIPNVDTQNYPFCRLQLANDNELLLIMEQSIFLLLLFHTSDKTLAGARELISYPMMIWHNYPWLNKTMKYFKKI